MRPGSWKPIEGIQPAVSFEQVERSGDAARTAFAKVGLLMASSDRSRKPLHPTNLHVNKNLFPNDTVQSRLPDPSWLEHWLDSQISFNRLAA